MRKKWCIVVAGVILSLSTILMGQTNTVHVAGLRVVGRGYGLNGTELKAFHQQSGITLALVVEAPANKKIVDVDEAKCSLVEFTDDLATDLLDGIHWGSFPEISKNGRLVLLEVSSKRQPNPDAARLLANGTIHLRVATSVTIEKIENLKMDVGSRAMVQQHVIQVMKVQEDNDSVILVLQMNRTFVDNMKDIRFFTKTGDPVEVWGRGSFAFGNASQMEYNLDIQSIPDYLNIEIDIWQGLEVLNYYFAIEAGLGL